MEDHAVVDEVPFLVDEFAGEETGALEPGEEYAVALPQLQVEQLVIVDPAQGTLERVDQLAAELGDDEDESVPIFVVGKVGEGEKAFEQGVGGDQARFLADLADGAGFGSLTGLELAAQSVPFALVHIIGFFDAVDHEGLAVFLEVAQGGEFHGESNRLSASSEQ